MAFSYGQGSCAVAKLFSQSEAPRETPKLTLEAHLRCSLVQNGPLAGGPAGPLSLALSPSLGARGLRGGKAGKTPSWNPREMQMRFGACRVSSVETGAGKNLGDSLWTGLGLESGTCSRCSSAVLGGPSKTGGIPERCLSNPPPRPPDNFQDQMKRELAYREEMVQQLQIVRGKSLRKLPASAAAPPHTHTNWPGPAAPTSTLFLLLLHMWGLLQSTGLAGHSCSQFPLGKLRATGSRQGFPLGG